MILDAMNSRNFDIKFVRKKYRICLPVKFKDQSGDFYYKNKWCLAKSKKHRNLIKVFLENKNKKQIKTFKCAFCSGEIKAYAQWKHRDYGYGGCTKCFFKIKRVYGDKYAKKACGVAGTHHSISEQENESN